MTTARMESRIACPSGDGRCVVGCGDEPRLSWPRGICAVTAFGPFLEGEYG